MSDARRGRRLPFVILPWAVLDDENLTAHDVLVYATISRYADSATGVAWPSRSTVAEQARCDIKTVDRSVQRLVAAGFLEKHKRRTDKGDEANVYVIHEIVARQEQLEPAKGGRDFRGTGGGDLNGARGGTQTVRELEPIELDKAQQPLDYTSAPDTSEWTPMPDHIRAMLKPPPNGETAA